LQHEYGIFGGPAGSHILELLRRLQMPVVTTLHTVLRLRSFLATWFNFSFVRLGTLSKMEVC